MIDKSRKLQRYGRKDYSDLVEFPVEIVGRDGLVRRYTFEDSVRLYQRRVTFAPIRYRDGDLVRAEMLHCNSRIAQLRRSYFHRHGWGTPDGEVGPEVYFNEISGELAAFLCRVLRCSSRPEIAFAKVESDTPDESSSVWYVTPRGGRGMLLYVRRFRGESADRLREAFFSQLKGLERVVHADGEVERLLAFHHTVDCGFILAGRGDELDDIEEQGEEPSIDFRPTPWDEVLELLRRGEYEGALGRCKELVTDQPWHRDAYTGGALLALHLGKPQVAEDLARIGVRYFPKDGLLFAYLGAAYANQERGPEATTAFTQAADLLPELGEPHFVLSKLAIANGDMKSALLQLAKLPPEFDTGIRSLPILKGLLRLRNPLRALGLGLITAGVLGTWWLGPLPILVSIMGIVVATVVDVAVRHLVNQVLACRNHEDLATGMKRLQDRAQDEPGLV